ncbi:MAG: response regulator transcription factor [Alphaproteobacteria bacterium]
MIAGRAEGDAAAWYRELGGLVEDQACEDLPERLVRALGHLLLFELAAVFVYRGRSRPLVIYDNFDPGEAKQGITTYVENTYVLNPFYQAYQRGLPDGVYRIRDLAPDAFFTSGTHNAYRVRPRITEEIGYITEHWPEGMEEIDIAVTLEPKVVAELSIYRALRKRGFDDGELARVSAAIPLIRALLRRYWRELGTAGSRAAPPDTRVDEAFADFGAAVLTGREREVAQLILRGHSSQSICFNLGISLGTVKTHRKNAYAKLEISSQSELLSLFLRSLQAP